MTTLQATGDALPDAGATASDAEPARLLEDVHDGIREYDNPLPGWWRMTFWGSIVFAGFYALYFHVVGWGAWPEDKYRGALAEWESKRAEREAQDLKNVSEGSLAEQARDGKVIAHGAEVFAARCASCHGPEGAGLVGPNLTDGYQIHGSSRLDLYRTVYGGAPGTAMPAWGDQLAPADVVAAAAFAITLRGTNKAGKVPEGAPVGAFAP